MLEVRWQAENTDPFDSIFVCLFKCQVTEYTGHFSLWLQFFCRLTSPSGERQCNVSFRVPHQQNLRSSGELQSVSTSAGLLWAETKLRSTSQLMSTARSKLLFVLGRYVGDHYSFLGSLCKCPIFSPDPGILECHQNSIRMFRFTGDFCTWDQSE